jgi:hypothetical protein
VQLALRHPHLIGTGFDLRQVRRVFEKFVAEHLLGSRVSICADDFFANPLPSAEVDVFGHVVLD